MEVTARSCLLALVLCCNVTAATIQEKVKEEKTSVHLRCPQSVEDKSLHIYKATLSDTGRYFCNNKPAVDLTVIPTGTVIFGVTERTSVTLSCPSDVGGSDVPTRSSDAGELKQRGRQFHVSTDDKTFTIKKVTPADSGLYICGGKAAAYLNVITGDQSERGTETSPSISATPSAACTAAASPPTAPETAASYWWQMSARPVIVILYLIVMISITVTTWREARQIEKRHKTETGNDV
uniref:uncharacterized protein isoform X2 n=1 Tax=Semicossyphus pulcher TaxID=241346 RepID=UPI0037E9310A